MSVHTIPFILLVRESTNVSTEMGDEIYRQLVEAAHSIGMRRGFADLHGWIQSEQKIHKAVRLISQGVGTPDLVIGLVRPESLQEMVDWLSNLPMVLKIIVWAEQGGLVSLALSPTDRVVVHQTPESVVAELFMTWH